MKMPITASIAAVLLREKDYAPFWHTPSTCPWNVKKLFTDVVGGAPKYGRVTRSCRW
jgi:hypothetical protein